MFELYEIARNSRFEKEEFIRKILPFRVEELDFDDPKTFKTYRNHWEGQIAKWKENLEDASQAEFARYQRAKRIYQNIGDLLSWIGDLNTKTNKI